MQTANQIIETLNSEIKKNPDKRYTMWDITPMVISAFGGKFHFSDYNGVYIYANKASGSFSETVSVDNKLILIKAKRKQIMEKTRWDGTKNVLSIISLELLTPNIGDKTADEIYDIYKQQSDNEKMRQQSAEKQDYQTVSDFLKRTGSTIDEIAKIYHTYDKRRYSWEKLREKYGA